MKTSSRIRFALLILPALAIAMYAGDEYPLSPSSIVPAATGTVKVDQDKNKNTVVEIKVRHLAKPENLTPPQSTYIVWIQQRGEQPENAGQLRVNNDLEGEFRTTTPYKNFEVFITAENGMHATTPSSQTVLRQQVNR